MLGSGFSSSYWKHLPHTLHAVSFTPQYGARTKPVTLASTDCLFFRKGIKRICD